MKLTLTDDAPVVMLTFGSQQAFTWPKGYEFHYGKVLTTNEHYTVFQNGLNHYVIPTCLVQFTKGENCGEHQH